MSIHGRLCGLFCLCLFGIQLSWAAERYQYRSTDAMLFVERAAVHEGRAYALIKKSEYGQGGVASYWILDVTMKKWFELPALNKLELPRFGDIEPVEGGGLLLTVVSLGQLYVCASLPSTASFECGRVLADPRLHFVKHAGGILYLFFSSGKGFDVFALDVRQQEGSKRWLFAVSDAAAIEDVHVRNGRMIVLARSMGDGEERRLIYHESGESQEVRLEKNASQGNAEIIGEIRGETIVSASYRGLTSGPKHVVYRSDEETRTLQEGLVVAENYRSVSSVVLKGSVLTLVVHKDKKTKGTTLDCVVDGRSQVLAAGEQGSGRRFYRDVIAAGGAEAVAFVIFSEVRERLSYESLAVFGVDEKCSGACPIFCV